MSRDDLIACSLVGSIGLAVIAIAWCYAAMTEERQRRERLEHWLRKNLVLIRAHVGSASPEVVSVIASLECALPVLAPLDIAGLEQRVFMLRLEREGRLLRSAPASLKGGPR